MSHGDGDTRARDEFGRTITREHTDAQKCVCAICFKKAGGKNLRPLTEDQKDEIVKCGVFTDFCKDEFQWLPTVICVSCRLHLGRWSNQRKSGVDIK